MKLYLRILCAFLCAVLIVCMPFFLSSPSVLPEARENTEENSGEDDDGESLDFGLFLIPHAMAEEEYSLEEVEIQELSGEKDQLSIPDAWELPVDDFSIPPLPDPDCFTEKGYEDQSIRVRVEELQMMESVVHAAYVEIASPTQLRTATAYGVSNGRGMLVKEMAKKNQAVIAINGDYFAKDPDKKRFEIRMKQVVTYDFKRLKTSNVKDTMVIDSHGDLHLLLNKSELSDYYKNNGNDIINAFMFGPALVVNGEIYTHDNYDYNRTGREPRAAFGQTGPLSYLMVVVEARGSSKGVSHEKLAEIMKELGCVQAYNLDGGNSAEMVMPGPDPDKVMFQFRGDQAANPRTLSDILFFATAVPVEERK